MKILYIECNMGAAGDMLTAALSELLPNSRLFFEKMNSLHDGIEVLRTDDVKCGICGSHVTVKIHGETEGEHHHHEHEHQHEHHHNDMHGIKHIIDDFDLPESVKKNAVQVYNLIADAEGKVHGKPCDEVHFHEVGALDAVFDIVGVCLLIEMLGPERIIVSPVNTGSGFVKAAHGILPVPAPATANILHGIPVFSGGVSGELCTPTGAALLKHFASEFSQMPAMRIEKTGIGTGNRDFESPNCVRAFLGEAEGKREAVSQLCANLDDMTAESLAIACEILLENGALDVFQTPIIMKKGRAAYMLTVLCKPEEKEKFAALLFKYTKTLGVRESECPRYTLARENVKKETPLGSVRFKKSSGFDENRAKPEYEDVCAVARKHNISFDEAMKIIGQV